MRHDDKAVERALGGATVTFPSAGALRVHRNPDHVYQPQSAPEGEQQDPGPNRFDDPYHHYPVRYLAEQLSVCLLEVLAWFRPNATADALLEAMTAGLDAPGLAGAVDPERVEGVEAFLATNKVGLFIPSEQVPLTKLVDVFDPDLLAALDKHHRLRPHLNRPGVVRYFGDSSGAAHLDGGLIRNASKEVGRPVTQEISWLLLHVQNRQGLRYSSRHSTEEEGVCWALRGGVPVDMVSVAPLDPDDAGHRAAVQQVAARYDLPLPSRWSNAVGNQPLKPGQIAPTSGRYGLYGPRGGDLHREITITRGQPMPPTARPGQTYRIDDVTKHRPK